MDINDTQIDSTASQPLNNNAHNEPSIFQLISPGIPSSSQPALAADHSRLEMVTRHREARQTRRRRRTPSQHRPLAQQIRRRQMASQYHQQQQYYQNLRHEERVRQEPENQDRSDYTQPRPTAVSEQFEEVTEEQLQEVYDWEIMQLMDDLEQEQLQVWADVAALEQLLTAQSSIEQSHQPQTSKTLGGKAQHIHQQGTGVSTQTKLDHIEDDSRHQSLDSILCHKQGTPPMNDLGQSTDTTEAKR